MVDLFGPTQGQLQEVAKALAASDLALWMALEEKGLLTAEDITKHQARALALIDQGYEQQIRERNAEALRENPGWAILAKLCGTEFPLPVNQEAE